jgi:hypothetical protein
MEFSAPELIKELRIASSSFPDNRTGTNTRYSMEDVVLGAFSVFLTQSPSFLSFQHSMREKTGRDNGQSLFSMRSLPTDDQIRQVLDGISPNLLFPVFEKCLNRLVANGDIEQFKSDLGYLVALDGTQYFSSDTIHCRDCLTKTDKKTGTVTYYHAAITPVIVKPGDEHVLSLVPEYIIPQDGSEKQDCEIKASKRLLLSHIEQVLCDMEVTYLGDDLYAHEPFCRDVLRTGHSFIFTCKPESHKTLYEWIKGITKEYVQDRFDGKKHRIYTYKYARAVPLRDEEEALLVNFVEVTVTERQSGKQLYHNAFITNHPLTTDSLPLLVDCGRARWKIENENNNTLKTKGYYFEHNYGHGDNGLSMVLTTLILLAFLFHTLFSLFWTPYIHMLERVKRVRLFEAIRTLAQFYYAPNWEHLFAGMEYALDHVVTMPLPFSILPAG